MVGVSADKPEIQQRFIDKFELTFPLISDREHEIIAAYGAEKVTGVTAARKTFLISPNGTISQTWPKVKVEGHADDVLSVVANQAAG